MTGKNPHGSPLGGLAILLLFLWFGLTAWRHRRSQQRLLAIVEDIAERGGNVVGGHSLEHWLDVLNQDGRQALTASEAFVFKYKGQELYFVDGRLAHLESSYYTNKVQNLFFLVAVGQSAVTLLSDHEHMLRKIAGSEELAAFSVFRVSRFAAMLSAEADW